MILITTENGIHLSGNIRNTQRGIRNLCVHNTSKFGRMKFKPKIMKFDPVNELKWLGKLWIPKLFDGEHSLIIKKIDDDNV